MRSVTVVWEPSKGWSGRIDNVSGAQLVIYFGRRDLIASGERLQELAAMFTQADVLGCSTGGQIAGGDVTDESVVAIAMHFEQTRIEVSSAPISGGMGSQDAGEMVGRALAAADLKSIFLLSDGLNVNGSALVRGVLAGAGQSIVLTGGLAGDGPDFSHTLVGLNETPREGKVVAVGFYGNTIQIGHGSAGGWDRFGPKRLVTSSKSSVLYSLDGKPALDLYERYLGDDAAGLPGTALLYPLLVSDPLSPETSLVRTVLAVDRIERSMTFAGDVPEGWTAQLMQGHFDRLSDGAAEAARQASLSTADGGSDVAAILISCIGRRLLMGQSVVDEIVAAEAQFGPHVSVAGFYSYGEISPHGESGMCELHNQTMTVTTISERL